MNASYDAARAQSNAEPQVVMFTAAWCGPCKMLKPSMHALKGLYGFQLAEIDIDAVPQGLLMAEGVRSVPTVHLLQGGKVAASFMGARTQAQIKTWLTEHRVISDGLDFE